MVGINESIHKRIVWHVVGHHTHKLELLSAHVTTILSSGLFCYVLLNRQLCSQVNQSGIYSPIIALRFLLLSESINTFIVSLNRKILEVHKS